jgi:hypothetical protein
MSRLDGSLRFTMADEQTTYVRWLIAKGNVFLPSAGAVAKVIEELKKANFIPEKGGHAIKTVEATDAKSAREDLPANVTEEWLDDPDREEIRLIWPAKEGATKYPLSMTPPTVAYAIEVHRAPEYVYPVAKSIGRLPTVCKCGEELDFEWDEDEVITTFASSTGIFAECDECSRTFDPSTGSAKIKNPFDPETKDDLPGGAAYRFAIKVDCGKNFVSDANMTFDKELVAIVEKTFGRQFYEVAALY